MSHKNVIPNTDFYKEKFDTIDFKRSFCFIFFNKCISQKMCISGFQLTLNIIFEGFLNRNLKITGFFNLQETLLKFQCP